MLPIEIKIIQWSIWGQFEVCYNIDYDFQRFQESIKLENYRNWNIFQSQKELKLRPFKNLRSTCSIILIQSIRVACLLQHI